VPYITVDDEQARLIAECAESLEIRDQHGKCLGYVAHGFSDEDIEIALQRMHSDEPRYTTAEVLQQLASLEQE